MKELLMFDRFYERLVEDTECYDHFINAVMNPSGCYATRLDGDHGTFSCVGIACRDCAFSLDNYYEGDLKTLSYFKFKIVRTIIATNPYDSDCLV